MIESASFCLQTSSILFRESDALTYLTFQFTFLCQIASHLFEFVWNLWKTDIQKILQSLSVLLQSFSSSSLVLQQGDLILICERWLYCSKIIQQLIICGYPSDTTSPEVN